MSGPRRRLAAVLVAFAVAGCGSTVPSTSPVSPSAVVTTAPSIAPSSGASAVPSIRPGELGKGVVAVTVSDRLRVRSKPVVSDDSIKYEPVLPLGTSLFVLDGPVVDSGYTWYKVAPVSFSELAGPGFGWVASADHDGTPWIAPAQGATADLAVAMSTTPRAAADPAAAKSAATSIDALGIDIHRALLADKSLDLGKRNTVFSPASIAIALAMARGGAKGTTATEMDKVLHASGWDSLASGLNSLDRILSSRNASWTDSEGAKQLTLKLANAPFAQRGWTIEPGYLDALGAAFGAGLRLVDYEGDPNKSRETINAWVKDRTAGRIPKLLSEDQITDITRLVLVNAIYLKAQWALPFDEDRTEPAPFTRLDGSKVNVPTMNLGGRMPYARGTGWQATELQYLDPDKSHHLAMLLIRPDDIATFEAGLTAKQLDGIAATLARERAREAEGVDCPGVPHDQQDAGCYPYDLSLAVPRFSAGTHAGLNTILKSLGMSAAFDATTADFSGIHKGDPLYIGFVVHQANIDVDEKGTEAAAATAVGVDTGGGPSAIKQITLKFDRPFLFFVRDVDTGAILFMGRIVDPSVPRT
jgi:serpin B